MKKICFMLTLGTMLSLSVIAQEGYDLKPFKADVSLGYAIPQGTGSKGGILFVVEPKYAVLSKLSVGLRMEGAIVARFSGYDSNGDLLDASIKVSSSYLATADYYFTDNYNFRPFAGVGTGVFLLTSVDFNSDDVIRSRKFGGMIRAGVEISHFRVGFEYNLIPKTTFTGYDSNGNLTPGLISKNGYIGIKIGACFGGGPL
jgi:opacity protein-like surface antigen